MEQTQTQMPADEPAEQEHAPKEQAPGFIKTNFNIWQSMFLLFYVATAASTIFVAASCDLLS
jgi:hypothetical protein